MNKILKIGTGTRTTYNGSAINVREAVVTLGKGASKTKVRFEKSAPEIIRILTKILPIREFRDVVVDSSYVIHHDGRITNAVVRPYSSGLVKTDRYVSAIKLEVRSTLTTKDIPKEICSALEENKIIYEKRFLIQEIDETLKMYQDPCKKGDDVHFVSDFKPLAGKFYKGIPIKNISQSMFMIEAIGEGRRFKQISLNQYLDDETYKIPKQIDLERLKTLEDDIVDGAIRLKLEFKGDPIEYQSVYYKEVSSLSSVIELTFRTC